MAHTAVSHGQYVRLSDGRIGQAFRKDMNDFYIETYDPEDNRKQMLLYPSMTGEIVTATQSDWNKFISELREYMTFAWLLSPWGKI